MSFFKKFFKNVKEEGSKFLGTSNERVCPFCLSVLKDEDVMYFCPKCNENVEKSGSIVPKCPTHLVPANNLKCKHCIQHGMDTQLKRAMLEFKKNIRFCIMGVPGSGKTILMTTMLKEVQEECANLDWNYAPLDRDFVGKYYSHKEKLYELQERIEASPRMSEESVLRPNVWVINDNSKRTSSEVERYSVTIFDHAGEDCKDVEKTPIQRCVAGAKTLMIVIDPLNFKSMNLPENLEKMGIGKRNASRSSNVYDNKNEDSAIMVNRMSDIIRDYCNMESNSIINKYVAVVITKIDLLKYWLGDDTVMHSSRHADSGGFRQSDCDEVHAQLKAWLEKMRENEFLNAIKNNFNPEKVRFFGVSSYGLEMKDSDMKDDGHIGKIKPHRVTDPMFWMMANEGIIPIS